MKSNTTQKFNIAIRIRPTLQEDYKSYQPKDIQSIVDVNNLNTITIQRKRKDQKIFKFNNVFEQQTQAQIYENSSYLVNSIFQGHNATFLAYGQTGTGKTFTVFGGRDPSTKGYFQRAAEHIFTLIRQKMSTRQFAVRISFIEFYLDNVYDLIQNSNKKMEIKQTAEEGIFIKDLSEIPVKSVQQLLASVKLAVANRKTSETSINKRSSRSHAVIQIQVLQRWNENGETLYQKGVLKIVDLAGSQRVSKTESYGPRLEQAKRINKQITTLGKCINILAQNEKQTIHYKPDFIAKFNLSKMHVPYRDCKITRYLTDTLEGKSKIFLCVCVSKFNIHLEQTFSSLMFATQASTLKIQSRRNQIYSLKKSAEKPNKSFNQTPLKTKPGPKSISIIEQQQTKQMQEASLKRLLQQIDQIESYIEGQGISTKQQSKQKLQQNLRSYEKIFTIMRNKMEKSNKSEISKYPFD